MLNTELMPLPAALGYVSCLCSLPAAIRHVADSSQTLPLTARLVGLLLSLLLSLLSQRVTLTGEGPLLTLLLYGMQTILHWCLGNRSARAEITSPVNFRVAQTLKGVIHVWLFVRIPSKCL